MNVNIYRIEFPFAGSTHCVMHYFTPEAKAVIKTAVTNWLQKKNRRLQRPPVSINKDATSTATQKPVLVAKGALCDSPYA